MLLVFTVFWSRVLNALFRRLIWNRLLISRLVRLTSRFVFLPLCAYKQVRVFLVLYLHIILLSKTKGSSLLVNLTGFFWTWFVSFLPWYQFSRRKLWAFCINCLHFYFRGIHIWHRSWNSNLLLAHLDAWRSVSDDGAAFLLTFWSVHYIIDTLHYLILSVLLTTFLTDIFRCYFFKTISFSSNFLSKLSQTLWGKAVDLVFLSSLRLIFCKSLKLLV